MTDLLTSPAALRRDIERFKAFAEELRDHVSDLQDTLDEVLERETVDEVAELKWQLQEAQRDLRRLREENAHWAAEVATLMSKLSSVVRCKDGIVSYLPYSGLTPAGMNEMLR